MSNRVVQMTQMLFRAEDSCADNLILNTIEAGFTKYVEQKVEEYCHHSITCAVKHLSSDCSVLSDEGATSFRPKKYETDKNWSEMSLFLIEK